MINGPTYSRFEALFLPAIVAQSIIIGGGYSSGREIVQYAGRFGPKGWLAVLVIFVGFSVVSMVSYELSRIGRAYDYKRWIRLLIGPLWPLFDVAVVVSMLLTIAVISAAAGSILQQTLRLPSAFGLGIVFVLVGFLAWKGAAFIEVFKTVGSVGLYLAYAVFAALVLSSSSVDVPVDTTAPVYLTSEVLVSAVQYVGYNLGVIPPVLFCLYRQMNRTETAVSGLLTGVSITAPLALTFLCLMRFWPDTKVIDAEVPWLQMLQSAAGQSAGVWISVYGLVVGWTLMETTVGSIHAVVDRIESNLNDLPRIWRPRAEKFEPWQRAALSIIVLIIAGLMTPLGIKALVEKGYGALSWAFLLLLAFPLLTVGVFRVLRARKNSQSGLSRAIR